MGRTMQLRLVALFAYIYCNSSVNAEAYQYEFHRLCGNLCVKCSPHLLGKRSVDNLDSIRHTEEEHLQSGLQSGLEVLHRDSRSPWNRMDSLMHKRTPGSTWLNDMTKFYKKQKRDNKKIVTVRRDDWQNLCYTCRYTC